MEKKTKKQKKKKKTRQALKVSQNGFHRRRIRRDIFGVVDEIYVANKAKLKSFFSFASRNVALRFHHTQLLLTLLEKY